MTYNKKSGRYTIRNERGYYLQFPTHEKVYKIWQDIFPNTDFMVTSLIGTPTIGFFAKVGTGTKPNLRQKFCDALACECTVVDDTFLL